MGSRKPKRRKKKQKRPVSRKLKAAQAAFLESIEDAAIKILYAWITNTSECLEGIYATTPEEHMGGVETETRLGYICGARAGARYMRHFLGIDRKEMVHLNVSLEGFIRHSVKEIVEDETPKAAFATSLKGRLFNLKPSKPKKGALREVKKRAGDYYEVYATAFMGMCEEITNPDLDLMDSLDPPPEMTAPFDREALTRHRNLMALVLAGEIFARINIVGVNALFKDPDMAFTAHVEDHLALLDDAASEWAARAIRKDIVEGRLGMDGRPVIERAS